MQNKNFKSTELIAVVGMGVNVPGADNLKTFWENILSNKTFFEKAKISDWGADPNYFYQIAPAYDKTYSLYSAFNRNCRLDFSTLNLPPGFDPHTADASLLYWLSAGHQASKQVNYKNILPHEVGVISGHVILPTTAMAEATVSIYGQEASKKWNLSSNIYPPPPQKAFTALGFSANLLRDTLGFSGTSYTLDAACASSLYAAYLAIEELLSGRLKAVITGGVAKADALFTQLGFTQLKALSAKGLCTPFDNSADGLVVGEGAAALVLKRLDQALKDEDKIYALIKGVGLSNDQTGSLLAPQVEGQKRSMEQAWKKARLSNYSNLGLIEAHGTSTVLGDNIEVKSLKDFFKTLETNKKSPPPVLSSIKGNIGHLLSAAGAVSLVKAVLALHNKILPPTAGFKNEAMGLNLESFPKLRILKEKENWPTPENGKRLAVVNAFGFGGVNAQVVLEEWLNNNYTETENIEIKEKINKPIHLISARALLAPWPNYSSLCQHWLNPEDPPLMSSRKFASAKASGLFFENFYLDAAKFKLTPKELANILPQQALALKVSQEALEEANLKEYEPLIDKTRIGVFMGVDIDPRAGAYAFRWLAPIRAAEHLQKLGLLQERDMPKFIQALKDKTNIPPLNASKVIGSLGSIVASRVSRHLNAGGPSFTVCQVNRYGLKALDIAIDFINRGEIDLAIVNAVDTIGDPKTAFFEPGKLWEEGAAALILASAELAEKINKKDSLTIEKIKESNTKIGSLGGLLTLVKNAFYLKHRYYSKRFSSNFSYHLNNENYPKRQFKAVGYEIKDTHNSRKITKPLKAYNHESWFLIKANNKNKLEDEIKIIQNMLAEEKNSNKQADFIGPEKAEKTALSKIAYKYYLNSINNKDKPFLAIPAKNFYELREKLKLIDYNTKFYNGKSKILTVKASNLKNQTAWLYPGSGAHYQYLAKQLGLDFPSQVAEIENSFASGSQFFQSHIFWQEENQKNIKESEALIAQANFALLTAKILKEYNLKAEAHIGYSLGETSSLIATEVWPNLEEIYKDLQSSSLFKTDLAGPLNAARKYWNYPKDKKIKWLTGVIPKNEQTVKNALNTLNENFKNKVFLLIVNSQNEVLIGGEEEAVKALVHNLKSPFFALNSVSVAHNPIVKIVEDEYENFHKRDVNKNINTTIYSPALLKEHTLEKNLIAKAITKQATEGHNFQKLIEKAYDDGIRYFIELGPGKSLTSLVRNILKGKSFFSEALFKNHYNEGTLSLNRLLVKLWLSGYNLDISKIFINNVLEEAKIPVEVNFNPPQNTWDSIEDTLSLPQEKVQVKTNMSKIKKENTPLDNIDYLAWLKLHTTSKIVKPEKTLENEPQILLNREKCLEFAVGKIAPVLGKQFAPVDMFPSRVRLPDEPLMFVDRILLIEGQALSMSSGRLVSQHDVLKDAWYLDNNNIPTGFAIESGQADLLLSAWLGADFATRGKAHYRLLDAEVTFFRDLPKAGETTQYDIKIIRFFKHAQTHLFRFEFTATIDGKPLLQMRNGCAGFFTKEELASGRGLNKMALKIEKEETNTFPSSEKAIFFQHNFQSFSETQIKNLREKELQKAFGENYINIKNPLTIPDNKMALIDKVLNINLQGGKYKNGFIETETKIDPQAWFLTSHFLGDEVMPGTLMYETCLYSLRVFLLSIGWIGEASEVDWQPLLNSEASLKCRGQVTPNTKKASYQLHIKELGFNPEPYAKAEAIMLADGHPIVEVKNMTLRLKNSSFAKLQKQWASKDINVFNKKMLLAHADGCISDCLGARYQDFDNKNKFIARLPRPPYNLIDEAQTQSPPKVLTNNTLIAKFKIKKYSWLIRDSGGQNPKLNYAALNEIALQPCGFLASYMGSALKAPTAMHFRNLGGEAKIINNLTTEAEITTQVSLEKSSQMGDIIIQHYNFSCQNENKVVYEGKTHFGFFSPESLAKQAGLKEDDNSLILKEHKFKYFTNYPQGKSWAINNWKMLDKVALEETGGPEKLGWALGTKTVNPKDWFFKAHFHQDPVWPGSLGLEAFLQLAKVLIAKKVSPKEDLNTIMIDWNNSDSPHKWLYRGQVTPANKKVKIGAYIKKIENENTFFINGYLWVDDLLIYQMENFNLQVLNNPEKGSFVGARIKIFRQIHNLTQKKLAEQSSIHASTLSRIEKGLQAINEEQMEKLIKIFGGKLFKRLKKMLKTLSNTKLIVFYFLVFILVTFHQADKVGTWFENKARNNTGIISKTSFMMSDFFQNKIAPLGIRKINEYESLIISKLNPDKQEEIKEKTLKKVTDNFFIENIFSRLNNFLAKSNKFNPFFTKTEFQKIETKIFKPNSILLIGDSMMLEGLGPQLQTKLLVNTQLTVNRDGQYGTGLCRLDVFDWLEYFDEMLEKYKPNLVIITIGANDPQDIIITENAKKTRHFPATEEWNNIYENRVHAILNKAKNKNAKVFWVGLPIMAKEPYSSRIENINKVVEMACAKSENGFFWNSWLSVADDKGKYNSYLTDENKKKIKIRGSDNIHLTKDGGLIMADKFLEATKDWADYFYKLEPKVIPTEKTKKVEKISFLKKINIFESKKAWAQNISSQKVNLHSKYRNKNTVYSVITPPNSQNKKLPAIILLHGAWTNQNIWLSSAQNILTKFAEDNNVYIFMPDGEEFGWYVDSPYVENSQIESYLIKEFLPDIINKYNIKEDKIALTGLSMGGHGAFNLALNYENKFVSISSISGTLDITQHVKNNKINQSIKIHTVLGPYSENIKLWEQKSAYFQVKNKPSKLNNINIYLTVGLNDKLTLTENLNMHQLLTSLNIKHSYEESAGGHDWEHWLKVLNKHLLFHNKAFENE